MSFCKAPSLVLQLSHSSPSKPTWLHPPFLMVGMWHFGHSLEMRWISRSAEASSLCRFDCVLIYALQLRTSAYQAWLGLEQELGYG